MKTCDRCGSNIPRDFNEQISIGGITYDCDLCMTCYDEYQERFRELSDKYWKEVGEIAEDLEKSITRTSGVEVQTRTTLGRMSTIDHIMEAFNKFGRDDEDN